MKQNKELQGEGFILGSALLWGLFPVITVLSFSKLSPLLSLAFSMLFAAFFFSIMLTLKKKWHEIKKSSSLKDILYATFFIGILYYVFYFLGLTKTSPGNASIVALTEVFFSFMLFHVFKKEFIPKAHILGAILMVLGAIIVLYPNIHNPQIGDFFVMAAAFFAPFGNFFQQKARKQTSSEGILFIRCFISSITIFILSFFLKIPFSWQHIQDSWWVFIINGMFILGLSKILWLEGIHRISVTKAVALESISPLLTLLFALIFLKTHPTAWQLLSFIPMFFGILLLSKKTDHKVVIDVQDN
ncbi:MAG TPA: DMT family transporter [Patescibacteria group bacterium]